MLDKYNFESTLSYAKQQDEEDALKSFRNKFHLPINKTGKPYLYFCGNSLGLQPKSTFEDIKTELEDWKNLGVEGHFHAKNAWMPYHEFLTQKMANVVGAKQSEVVVMNTLSVNLHLLMVSFYNPTAKRNKILIEADAFPSDKYAVKSQIKFHGYNPKESLIELKPRANETCLRIEDIEETIKTQGEEIALILLGNTNYYTGQFFDMKKITELGKAKGCNVGFDCAHAAGNVPLNLSDTNCDFAVWCNYKYLNSGPGSLAGAFVNEKHFDNKNIKRFEGWWGHEKSSRFKMPDEFVPIKSIEAWQLSNPPILSMAAIWSSLKIFEEAGIENLRTKSLKLTSYLEFLVKQIGEEVVSIITPNNENERGAQLSIQVKNADKKLYESITKKGVIADWREPDVIRVAPVPLYNTFSDVFNFYEILRDEIELI